MANKRVRKNRPIEREAVNAIRSFLDRHNIPFVEVPVETDFGKDLYVELADTSGVTGRSIAVQSKGGEQTIRERRGDVRRGIPFTRDDATVFRQSNIPVIGMTTADIDGQLLWVNLSQYCSERFDQLGKDRGGFAPITDRLDDYRLPAFVKEMLLLTKSSRNEIALDLASDDVMRQRSAILDCFGLSLRDARPLLLVRRIVTWLHDQESARLAVLALAHHTPHPDIFYHPGNTPDHDVEQRIRAEMLWSPTELSFLLSLVDDEIDMWGRGTFGQHIISLIMAVPANLFNLLLIAKSRGQLSLSNSQRRAFVIALYMVSFGDFDEGIADDLIASTADIHDDVMIREVVRTYHEHGYVDIF